MLILTWREHAMRPTVLFVAATLAAVNASPAFTQSMGEADWKAQAVSLAKAEPQVVDAMFSGASSFWTSALDDGSRRDGFADYLCLVMHDAGMPSGDFYVIRVWDAAAMARDEMKEIGRAECARD
jgi:hypothetical protein